MTGLNEIGTVIESARVARDSGDFAAADALLTEAIERFPAERNLVLEHAWVAHVRHDWPEAAKRWSRVRESHGSYAVGYSAGAAALRETGRFDEAEALLIGAISRFPDEAQPAIEFALVAHARRDWGVAIGRWA